MGSAWIHPFILLGGVLQAMGGPMNAQLKASLSNAWLASARTSPSAAAAATTPPPSARGRRTG